jgi:hypothetical protein
MTWISIFGVLLVAMLAMAFPALCHKRHYEVIRDSWRRPLALFFGLIGETLGTVTVTYFYPVAGTVAPTQAVMAQHNVLVAQVFMDTSDTVATVTHNFNLAATTTSGPPRTTDLFPEVNLNFNNLSTALPFMTITSPPGANTVGLNKTNLAASSCTVTVYIHRPYQPTI